MEQGSRLDSISVSARQDTLNCGSGDTGRDAAIAKMLTSPEHGVPQATSAAYHEPAAISPDLASAIEAHRRAQQAALQSSDLHDDRTFDASIKRITALGDVVRAIPSRSLADLRCKTIYLWPGSLIGHVADDEFADTLNSFRDDVERLAAIGILPGGLVDADLVALGRQFDEAHEAFRKAVEANREPSARYTAFLDAARKRGRPTMKDVEEAWALPGVAAAGDAEDDTFDSVAQLGLQVLRLEATSIAWLALKARCVIPNLWMDGSYEADASLGEHEDVPKEAMRLLIESCCAAAGVDWRGQPLAATPASPGATPLDAERHEYAFHRASTELRLATRDHERLRNFADEVWVEQNGGDASEAAMAPAVAARDAASDRQAQAWRDLFKIRPRTWHQLWLMLQDVAEHFDGHQGIENEPDVFGALISAVDGLRISSAELSAVHDMSLLTIAQLEDLADTCRHQSRVFSAFEDRHAETPLGAIYDIEYNRLVILGDHARDEITKRQPADDTDRNLRLESMIKADLAGNGYIKPALLAEAVAAWGTR